MMFPIIPFGLFLLSGVCFGQHFSYDGIHGPSNWGEEYHECIGKHQSPINIEEHNVRNVSLPPLKLDGIDEPCSSFLTNTGHTVMLKTNECNITLSGGPVRDNVYLFEQLHFHWGKDDREGSEDLINNHSFAMEMHAVFFKRDYNSMSEAVKYPDGLTVIANFYKISSDPNPTYQPIVKTLPDIKRIDTEEALHEPLWMRNLLVSSIATMQNYFTYNGSLTTPPCYEVVTWIDFKDVQYMSHDQIAVFRDLPTNEGNKLTHNFRPVQPLEDRIVFQNVPINISSHHHRFNEHSGQHGIAVPLSILALGIFFAILLFAI